jgi:DNA-directed RNA polymerase subunit RPC12/RpoP
MAEAVIGCADCSKEVIAGGVLVRDGMYSYDDRLICDSCIEEYFTCEVCESLFPEMGIDGAMRCPDCNTQ